MKTSLLAAALAAGIAAAPALAQAPTDSALAVSHAGQSLLRVNLDGSLVAGGTVGTGAIPASGPGTRMMWYPAKAAFRVGFVKTTQWEDASVGQYSMGLGRSVTASGLYSVALGLGGVASGSASVALGDQTLADSAAAIAFGTHAHAGGQGAVAGGIGSEATGWGAVALGDQASATGDDAVALGYGAHATGGDAVALGFSTAQGSYAFSAGLNTRADGYGVALGGDAATSGHSGVFIFGDHSTSSTVSAAADNQVVFRAQRFWLGASGTPTATAGRYVETSTGAYLSAGGTWTNSSDRNRKQAFAAVDGEDVLARLRAMPVLTWSYRAEAGGVRHMGPRRRTSAPPSAWAPTACPSPRWTPTA